MDLRSHIIKCKELIQKYNLAKYVICSGYISKNKLPEYYSIADLFVYRSRQEIFGLTLVEAGACGKAVIGSDFMGSSEIIIDGKTDFTSDFKDPHKLSELILELLNDKDRLTKMGKNGQELVKSKYSSKRTAELHLNLYKTLLWIEKSN